MECKYLPISLMKHRYGVNDDTKDEFSGQHKTSGVATYVEILELYANSDGSLMKCMNYHLRSPGGSG